MSKKSKSDDARTTMEISTKSNGIIMIGYPGCRTQRITEDKTVVRITKTRTEQNNTIVKA